MLRKLKFTHKIVLMHHPMCLKSPDEKSAYFNMPLPLRKQLLDLFAAHGVNLPERLGSKVEHIGCDRFEHAPGASGIAQFVDQIVVIGVE